MLLLTMMACWRGDGVLNKDRDDSVQSDDSTVQSDDSTVQSDDSHPGDDSTPGDDSSSGDDSGDPPQPPTTGFAATPTRWDVPDESMGGYGFYMTAQSYNPQGFWTLMDLTGDGLPDLVVSAPASSGSASVFGNGGDAYWQVYRGE